MKTFIKITSSFYRRKRETKPCVGSLFSLREEVRVLYYTLMHVQLDNGLGCTKSLFLVFNST